MFKNKKGMVSLIELMAAGLIAMILLAAGAYFLLPVQQTLTSTQNQAEYQVLADRLLKFTHNQLVYASQVKIVDNQSKLGKEYTSVLGIEGGKAILNGSSIYDFPSNIEVETEVLEKSDTYFLYEIRLLNKKSLEVLYKVSRTITIPFFVETLNSGDAYTADGDLIEKSYLLDDTDGKGINLYIGYNRTSLSGYEINTLADGVKANYEKLLREFIATPMSQRREKYGVSYVNNSSLRRYLLENVYEGVWPIVPRGEGGKYPPDLSLDNSKTYYIQPYYRFEGKTEETALYEDGKADITIFLKDGLDSGWFVSHMYDHEERQWYVKRGGYSCTNTFVINKKEMHTQNWRPVDFEKE